MVAKKEEPEWFTAKSGYHTTHVKNNPIFDMSKRDIRRKDVPTFPEVKVVVMDDFTRDDITKLYKPQKIVLRSYVRVPDDEGNNYFTMVMSETSMPGVDTMEERSKYISHVISQFNMQAYAMILLGILEPKLDYDGGKGIREPFYIPDNDTRTELERMKEMMYERGYKTLTSKT